MTVSSSLVAIKANVISTRATATTRLTTLLPSIDSTGDEQLQQQQYQRRAASTGSGLEASDDSEDICITCAASSSCAHTGKSLAKVDFRFRPPPTFSSSRCYSCYLFCFHCFSSFLLQLCLYFLLLLQAFILRPIVRALRPALHTGCLGTCSVSLSLSRSYLLVLSLSLPFVILPAIISILLFFLLRQYQLYCRSIMPR